MEHSTASLVITVWRSKLHILLIACFIFSLVSPSTYMSWLQSRGMSATVRLPGMGHQQQQQQHVAWEDVSLKSSACPVCHIL